MDKLEGTLIMLFKVKTKSIDYCVEEEDVFEVYWPEDQDWNEEDFENKIEEIKKELPQVLEFEIECDKEDLDEEIANAIGDETGWLVYNFEYEIK